jgi:hypothetical protein
MLDIACRHEEELKKLFLETWHSDHYKYWTFGCYSDQYEPAKNTWDKTEFVSLDSAGKVIGYIAYDVDRNTRNTSGLSALSFTQNKVVFGRDLLQAMKNIFDKYHFRKIDFSVVCGNPIERSYDRLVNKFGGRIVGTKTEHCRLIDGKYYDLKLYEVMNPNRHEVNR